MKLSNSPGRKLARQKAQKYLVTVMAKVERIYEVTATSEAEARRLFVEEGPDDEAPLNETDHGSEIDNIELAEIS